MNPVVKGGLYSYVVTLAPNKAPPATLDHTKYLLLRTIRTFLKGTWGVLVGFGGEVLTS